MNRPRCAVAGCGRRADTLVEGDDVLTGKPLPSRYACDDPNHQWAVALSIMPETPVPAFLADRVKRVLAAWNAEEAER